MKKTASAFICLFLAVLCYGQNFSRGEEFFMQNKPSEALMYLENAVIDDPADTMASLYLGIVYEQLERSDEAIAVYRRALPIAGKLSANFANNLGNVYFQKENTELAEQYYTQALASDVVFSRAYLGRANTRLKSGDLRNAVSDYEQYLTLEPRSPQRSRIEQVIAMLRAEFAAEERRRFLAEEAERVRAEERQRLLNDVSSSLQSAADSSQGMSFGAEDIEGYDAEFELE